mmetsp:Transcript_19510/g.41764  ORF Transcript_19510/g.41764 Transcript_19510/m.41764 type:complete len:258 (+) Transcript_19510:509-1282(+)
MLPPSLLEDYQRLVSRDLLHHHVHLRPPHARQTHQRLILVGHEQDVVVLERVRASHAPVRDWPQLVHDHEVVDGHLVLEPGEKYHSEGAPGGVSGAEGEALGFGTGERPGGGVDGTFVRILLLEITLVLLAVVTVVLFVASCHVIPSLPTVLLDRLVLRLLDILPSFKIFHIMIGGVSHLVQKLGEGIERRVVLAASLLQRELELRPVVGGHGGAVRRRVVHRGVREPSPAYGFGAAAAMGGVIGRCVTALVVMVMA